MKTSEILNLTEEDKEKINKEFIIACYYNNSEKVKEMLRGYCKVNYWDGTPIGNASSQGYLEIVKLLLEHGADPSIDDSHAVYWAYIRNQKEVVRLLIQDERVRNSLSEKEIEMYENI